MKGHGDKGVLLVSEKERREGSNWSERRSTRTSGLTTGTQKPWLVSERSTKARGLMSSERREKRAVWLI